MTLYTEGLNAIHFISSVYTEGLNAITNKYVREILKTGCLTKKGHRIKSMKERWFVLLPHMISYHENKSDKSKRKGVIIINKNTVVKISADTKHTRCRFVITCGEKNILYEIEAPTQKIKNEWVTAIQHCIDLSGEETPLMKVLNERYMERSERREKEMAEENQRKEQEALIQNQIEELEKIRIARDNESTLLEEERKRRENDLMLLEQERKLRENDSTLHEEERNNSKLLLEEERKKRENESLLLGEELVNSKILLEEERKRREELEQLKIEYEKLLEDERVARETENNIRLKQQAILEDETAKRLALEKIKEEQDLILEEERKMREGLEEISKKQAETLEQERVRLNELEKARQIAEAEVKEAHNKLEAAEEERKQASAKVEAAKERTRKIKLPVGLARPLPLEQKGLTTHRGLGSFVDSDFSKVPLYLSNELRPTAVNQSDLPTQEERAQIVESNLVKPSQSKATFENTES